MSPVFPVNIILHPGEDHPDICFAMQVLHPDREDARITRLPSSSCLCMQITLAPFGNHTEEIREMLEKNFPGYQEHHIIVTNMIQEKAHFDSRCSEIQMPLALF